jgi:hypothetical protein
MDPLSMTATIIAVLQITAQVYESYLRSFNKFKSRCDEYGVFPIVLLVLFFPNALVVMAKVEQYVIPGQDHEVTAFMKSYTSSFNMVGVAVSLYKQQMLLHSFKI